MKTKSIRMAILAVVFLATSVLSVAAQDHAMNMKEQQLTKKEVKALIVSAKTSEDHMKLASYFREEAQRMEASAKYHDEMAELYKANQTGKTDMTEHCKYFANEARKAAEAANSMADEHEKMASQARENK
jgi:signal transduction histidine kinase